MEIVKKILQKLYIRKVFIIEIYLLNNDILVVQAFNNKYYEYDESNYPTTLIIFYPLIMKYIVKNNIQDIISE